jgi:hypothetical protein
MNWIDIGPDIEAEAAEWEAEQIAMAEMESDDFKGLNSCDALRVMDGVPLTVEDEQ